MTKLLILSTITVICVTACRTIPPEIKTSREIKNSLITELSTNNTGSDQTEETSILNQQQIHSEGILIQAISIKYDTSAPPDRETGKYPVMETKQIITVKNNNNHLISQTEQHMAGIRHYDESNTLKTHIQNEEQSKTKQTSGKDPYRWRYLSICILTIVIGGFLIYNKFYRKTHM